MSNYLRLSVLKTSSVLASFIARPESTALTHADISYLFQFYVLNSAINLEKIGCSFLKAQSRELKAKFFFLGVYYAVGLFDVLYALLKFRPNATHKLIPSFVECSRHLIHYVMLTSKWAEEFLKENVTEYY